jgi:hypothetical protein
MAHEISALMGALDEEEWDREGLFHTVDELCKIKTGERQLLDPSLPLVFFLPEINYSSRSKGFTYRTSW